MEDGLIHVYLFVSTSILLWTETQNEMFILAELADTRNEERMR